MKTIAIFAAALMIGISYPAIAQTQSSPKLINIHDFYVQLGTFNESINQVSVADYQSLAPQSVLLQNSLADLSELQYTYDNSAQLMFSALIGLRFGNAERSAIKANPLLKLGVNYLTSAPITHRLYKETSEPYDTLVSTQTGRIIFQDSISREVYGLQYSYEQLRLHASLIFSTNPGARVSLYSGIGATAGVSINARTNIDYEIQNYFENRDDHESIYYSSGGTYRNESEQVQNKNNVGVSAFIPLGIDFRIGDKNAFFRQLHMFYELRPSLNITAIPELQTFVSTGLQQGLGLRVSWN